MDFMIPNSKIISPTNLIKMFKVPSSLNKKFYYSLRFIFCLYIIGPLLLTLQIIMNGDTIPECTYITNMKN